MDRRQRADLGQPSVLGSSAHRVGVRCTKWCRGATREKVGGATERVPGLNTRCTHHDSGFGAASTWSPHCLSAPVAWAYLARLRGQLCPHRDRLGPSHHHLMHYAKEASPGLMWFNFAHLFSVSLLPLSTA
jgi:hypothetical protein